MIANRSAPRRRTWLLLGLLLQSLPVLVLAQDSSATMGGFRYVAFGDSERVANWIMRYDRVAWITTDSVLAAPNDVRSRLGGEWFCFEADSAWHAVYGRYSADSDRYRVVLHYVARGRQTFRSMTQLLDTASFLSLARALSHGRSAFPDSLTRTGIAFNQYIRRLADSTIEIWYLPGQQTNGLITWGAEVRQLYTADGRTLLSAGTFGAGLRGLYADTTRQVDIDEEAHEVPSVGAIFALLAYHQAFRRVYVWTSGFLSTLVRGDDGQFVWIHAVRASRDHQ